jgi:hypothetical protein
VTSGATGISLRVVSYSTNGRSTAEEKPRWQGTSIGIAGS